MQVAHCLGLGMGATQHPRSHRVGAYGQLEINFKLPGREQVSLDEGGGSLRPPDRTTPDPSGWRHPRGDESPASRLQRGGQPGDHGDHPGPQQHSELLLSCSTPGATIHYQITGQGGSPGGTWTTFTANFSVAGSKRVFAYASAGAMIDSAVVRRDY